MIKNTIKHIGRLIDLITPRHCAICSTELLLEEKILCIKCNSDMPYTYFWKERDNNAAKRLWGRVYLESIYPLLFFRDKSPSNELIYKLKYRKRYDIGILLGKLIGYQLMENNIIQKNSNENNIELIIPVPLDKKKEIKRGYNQTFMIANGISSITGIPIRSNYLIRKENKGSQTKLLADQRWANVATAFHIKGSITVKNILVVDDVLTSGATVEACCTALIKNKADIKITVVTLAFVE